MTLPNPAFAPLLGTTLALLATFATEPTTPGSEVGVPPSMVLVEGGKTLIGNTEEEVIQLLIDKWPRSVVSTQPQMKMRLPAFFIMRSEVTNAQFAEFVKATGHRPPQHWGKTAIEAGRKEYLEAEGLKRKEARERGDQHQIRPFDPADWWKANWEGKGWTLPDGLEHHPVTYVDAADASAYARWAGMRLPTEFEYTRACRGDSKRTYPWGDEFTVRKYMQSQENGVDKTTEIGSFPAGSANGVADLAGNVWEWTSSPFVPLNKKYKPIEIKSGKGKHAGTERFLAAWDANTRVVVGGCYKLDKRAATITYRRKTERYQATDSLGFRCAATVLPGVDMAHTALAQDLPVASRPVGVTYDPSMAVAADRWIVEHPETKVPGYALIKGYEYALFFPVSKVPEATLAALDKSSKVEPTHLGVLSTTLDLRSPALSAGTYMVAYRSPGMFQPEKVKDEEGELVETEDPLAAIEFDREARNFIFYDNQGVPVTALPATTISSGKLSAPSCSVQEYRPTPDELEQDPTLEAYDTLRMQAIAAGRSSNKGFRMEFPLQVAAGALEGWRY